jgi:porin
MFGLFAALVAPAASLPPSVSAQPLTVSPPPSAEAIVVAAFQQSELPPHHPNAGNVEALSPAERLRLLPPLAPANAPKQAGTTGQLVTDPHLLGDWGGLRPKLAAIGIVPSIQYVGEGITNVSGGARSKALYDDQVNFAVSTDLKKLTGVVPGTLQLSINHRRGDNFNSLSGIGQLVSAHEVYGRGEIWRVGQIWYRITLGKFELKGGRMPLSEDWSSARCDFESLYLCGGHNGHVSSNVWLNYPVSMWGGRVRYNAGKIGFLQVGAYAVNPKDVETDRNFYVGWKGATGVTLPVELDLTPKIGGRLPGIYKIGVFYTTAPVNDPVLNTAGQIRTLAGGAPLVRGHQTVWWFNFRQQLVLPRKDGSHGLSMFFSSSLGDRAAATNRTIMGGGFNYTGVIPSRPTDEIGIGIGYGALNDRITDMQRALLAAGRTTAVRSDEVMLEAYYGINVMPGFVLRPDVQVGFNPGGDHSKRNVYMTGFKTVITL